MRIAMEIKHQILGKLNKTYTYIPRHVRVKFKHSVIEGNL